ncbi:hypothetical protein [Vibrio quintilis]|uniref:Outer membrane protein beta-barrel domain-containing protein n=1 Tax=Vibrio quintilis TaxID=1117707 RepID=A0A1M7Z0S9_9VIBR|nr:hypothetical protein [Vibrio quintilis]SHO58276.1 hypothetical protein VQ7734_04047 [Vibrio quintilis]
MNLNRLFFICFLGFSAHLYANEDMATPYISVLLSDKDSNYASEVGIRVIDGRFEEQSVAYAEYQDDFSKDRGVSFSRFLTTGIAPLKAYGGAGVFIGRHKECNRQDTSSCDTDWTVGIAPEAGLEVSILDARISVFSRYLRLSNGETNERALVGASIIYNFL